VSTQNDDITLIDELVNNASKLPLECQYWLLSVAKGMAFTRSCLEVEIGAESDEVRV